MNLDSMRIHRREFVQAGAGAALAIFGFRSRTVSASDTTVRFAYFGTEEEHAAYERLVAAFELAHPEIAIESIALASGDATLLSSKERGSPYQPWLRQAFGTDKRPDAFLLNYRNLGEFTSRSAIEPLDEWLASSTTLPAGDFYTSALGAMSFRMKDRYALAGIPQNASSLVVYYNKDLFDQAGVAYPANDWTWETFAETASALTREPEQAGGDHIYGLNIDPSLSRLAAFIWGAGGEFVDDPEMPTTVDLSSPGAVEGLNFFSSLGQTGRRVTPDAVTARTETDLHRFLTGRAAMFIHTRRVVPTLRSKAMLRWDVAPLPIGNQAANVLFVDGFCMASGSRVKDAAWTFIEFANGPVGQELLALTGRTVPSLRTVAESPSFLTGGSTGDKLGVGVLSLPPDNAQVFLDNIAISRRMPAIASWSGVEWEFSRHMRQAFYVDGDVTGAADRIVSRTKGFLGTPLTSSRTFFIDSDSETEAEE